EARSSPGRLARVAGQARPVDFHFRRRRLLYGQLPSRPPALLERHAVRESRRSQVAAAPAQTVRFDVSCSHVHLESRRTIIGLYTYELAGMKGPQSSLPTSFRNFSLYAWKPTRRYFARRRRCCPSPICFASCERAAA